MNKAVQRLLAWMLIACLPLVIAACGGGSGGEGEPAAPMTTLSGVASMGPGQGIQGAAVSIYTLLADGRTGALLGSGKSDSSGAYSVQIPVSSNPVLVEVVGQNGAGYPRVSTGQTIPFTAAETLRAVTVDTSSSAMIAVTPFTEAAFQKLQQILTANPSLANNGGIRGAINAANNRIISLIGAENILNIGVDSVYQAALLIFDQMIADSGPSANSVTVLNLMNQAYYDVTTLTYQNSYLLALNSAANKLKAANPNNAALIAALEQVQSSAAHPSSEPDWNDITAPTAPSNLKFTVSSLSATTSAVHLVWNPSSDNKAVAGYDIYRDSVKIATSATPEYTDRPLGNNATYRYYVFAFDAVGNRSVASNQVSVPVGIPVADTTPPSKPENLSASTYLTATTAQVVLLWSASTDNKAVAGYDVYRDTVKVATTQFPGYTDPSVALGTTYSYSIIAFDGAGNRSQSSAVLQVTPNRPSLGVTVNGQLSSGVTGQPFSDITAPTAPSNLTAATFAQTVTTSSVVLSWSPATDNVAVTGYEVYRMVSGATTKIATVEHPGYTDPVVTSNTTYTYFVIAFDASGNRSVASNQLSVTPNVPTLGVTVNGQLSSDVTGLPQQDISAPTAPSNLTAKTYSVTATTSAVQLSWSPSSDNKGVIGYEVYRNGSKIATVTLPGYMDPSVTSNVLYSYYVIAFDAAGNRSPASNQLSVTPNVATLGVTIGGQLSSDVTGLPQQDISAPTAPSNLTASTTAVSATTSSVLLAWNPAQDNIGVTGYDVYRNGTKIATVALLGYLDPSVTSNITYEYYVVAFDAAGNRSPVSNHLSVTPNRASLGVTVNGQLSSDVTGLPQQDITAPGAPSNMKASTSAISATTSSVLLSWSPALDNKAVTGYDVYRNGTRIATVSLLGYFDPSVTSNVTYSYQVVAFDAAGNRSPASTPLLVTPNQASLGVTISGQLSSGVTGQPQQDFTAPGAPSNLTASTSAISATNSSVLLSWNASSDNYAVAGYEIYRNGSKIATVTHLGYTDPSVLSSVTYSYYVVAFDAAGNRSPMSNVLSVTPNQASLGVTVNGQLSSGVINLPQQDVTSPTAPSSLTASTTAISATTSSVLLSWRPAYDNKAITGYDVYRNGSRIATVSLLGYLDPSVPSGVTSNYYIVAFDAAGNRSPMSNVLYVTPNQASLGVTISGQLSSGTISLPQQDITAPSAPSNLTATTAAVSATTSSVLLAWSPASDNTAVTGYEIYRNGAKIATVTTLVYTDPSVTSKVTYLYTIKALDAAGNRSPASDALSVTPNQASLGVTISGQLSPGVTGQPQADITAPIAPTNLTAITSAVTATTSSVLLSWSPASDNGVVAGYDVYRNGSKIATVSQLYYLDPSVLSAVTYQYYVVAFDSAGNRSAQSSQLTVTPSQASLGVTIDGQLSAGVIGQTQLDVIAPSAPWDLKATVSALSAATSSVFLSWSPATDNIAVTGYEIYRTASGITTKVASVAAVAYTDTPVASGITYVYHVVALDVAGNRSVASNQITVTPTQADLGVVVGGQLSFAILGL